MIEKNVSYNKDARGKLMKGANALADAVKVTLGASGKTVIIEDDFGRPHATKDGVTVARSIILSDPDENLGASILRQASMKTADLAGDGTTTSVVMAQAMLETAFKLLDSSHNVTKIRDEVERLSKVAVEKVKAKSREVTNDMLEDVATISANNDAELGKIIADAYKRVGVEGVVTIEESMTSTTYTTVLDGTRVKKGFHSPYMITNKTKKTVELDKPLVLVSDKKITSIEDIEVLLEFSVRAKRPLLIVSDVEDSVMNLLNVNVARGNIRVNVIEPEGVGMNRFELLDDLAVMTGAILISDETGNDFIAIDEQYLGEAEKSISNERETVITLNLSETADAVKERAEQVRNLITEKTDKENNWHHKDRLSRLSGGIAAIHVGASTEIEMKEKKDRVEDAIFATRAALEEGIVAGGGVAPYQAAAKIKIADGSEERIADLIVMSGLVAPLSQILENSDIDIKDFEDKLSSVDNRSNYGLNVKSGRYGDMFRMGIIDPFKVTKNAITNATSVVMTMLTTDCVISNKRQS